MTAPKTNKEHQRDHYNRQKAAGLKKVCVYVPGDKVNVLNEYAGKLRDGVKQLKDGD